MTTPADRNDFHALTHVPDCARTLMQAAAAAGVGATGMDSVKRPYGRRGERVNVDLSGYHEAKALVAVQVRQCRLPTGRFNKSRKDYSLLCHQHPRRGDRPLVSQVGCGATVHGGAHHAGDEVTPRGKTDPPPTQGADMHTHTETSQTHILQRDGLRALRFQGTLLAQDSGYSLGGEARNRYYHVAVYQHEDGRYILSWVYVTHWQGEEAHARAEVVATRAAVATALEDFDPTAWLDGYKALVARTGAHDAPQGYGARQALLERRIRERYAAQVRVLCAALGITEDL